MNEDIIKGKWKITRGKLKEKYGDLTDDDLREMEGRSDQVVGIIQRRTGAAREEIERSLEEMSRE